MCGRLIQKPWAMSLEAGAMSCLSSEKSSPLRTCVFLSCMYVLVVCMCGYVCICMDMLGGSAYVHVFKCTWRPKIDGRNHL